MTQSLLFSTKTVKDLRLQPHIKACGTAPHGEMLSNPTLSYSTQLHCGTSHTFPLRKKQKKWWSACPLMGTQTVQSFVYLFLLYRSLTVSAQLMCSDREQGVFVHRVAPPPPTPLTLARATKELKTLSAELAHDHGSDKTYGDVACWWLQLGAERVRQREPHADPFRRLKQS